MITKTNSLVVIGFILVGCSNQPEPVSISNNMATSQLFLVGEMSGKGYHYLGQKNNMMVFQSRKNKKIASFSISGDDKVSSIKYLGKNDKDMNNVINTVKSYSEKWKNKDDKQVTFSSKDKFTRETNSNTPIFKSNRNVSPSFSDMDNMDLLPKRNNNMYSDPMPNEPSRRYKYSNDPALKNRM